MAEFMSRKGFCIGNFNEEYLVSYNSTDIITRLAWSKDPAYAKVFPTIRQAKKFAKLLGSSFSVWQIDESPDNYYLSSISM